ncbi:tyrosine-type recombinase/integrase [Bradyrhizobium sp. USDA 4350]
MAFAEKDQRTKKLTGRWCVDFWFKAQGEPEKRMRRAFDSKKDAEANETYARQTGRWADPEDDTAAGPTFKQAAAEMRRVHGPWLKDRDPSGQSRLDWVIERIGTKPVKGVTTADLQGLVDDLKKRPVKSKRNDTGSMRGRTLNGYLTMASAVLTWAAARPEDYGTFTPPVVPWQETIKTRIHFMTDEQHRLLLKHFTEKGWIDEVLVARVFQASGMRWSEFEGLEPHMVQVSILANKQEIGWIKLDETKTDTPRDIPVPPQLARDLRGLLQNGYSPNYNRSRTRFDTARDLYGWNPALTMYGMRHAAATYLTKRGMQPAKIKQFMGHKAYSTTEQYIHVENEDLAEAALILNPTHGGEAAVEPNSNVVAIGKAS